MTLLQQIIPSRENQRTIEVDYGTHIEIVSFPIRHQAAAIDDRNILANQHRARIRSFVEPRLLQFCLWLAEFLDRHESSDLRRAHIEMHLITLVDVILSIDAEYSMLMACLL